MANNPNSEMQPITLEDAERTVEIYRAYQTLKTLPAWDLLMNKHFFESERLRLSDLLVHPEGALVQNRDEIKAELDALSRMKFHLQMVEHIGSQTERQLEEFREAQRAEIEEMQGA